MMEVMVLTLQDFDDVVYGVTSPSPFYKTNARLPSKRQVERSRALILRFLRECPPDMTVWELLELSKE